MAEAKTTLEADFEMFERNRKEWAQTHPGEFVVISSGRLGGFFADYETALREGLHKFGVSTEFLIKQVSLQEPVFFIY